MCSKRIRSQISGTMCVLSVLSAGIAHADLPTLPDPNSYLNADIANAIVKTIGLGLDYRAFEPASPLGTLVGFDFGIEASIAKPPNEVKTAISNITGSNADTVAADLPIIPSARFNIHKGIGSRVDLGFSYLPVFSSIPLIGGSSLIGGDVKICLYQPEEGVTIAVRASYNVNTLVINPITIKTTTFSPQIVFSKKLFFAEPYVGSGLQYTTGLVEATITLPTLPAPAPVIAPIQLSQTGKGYGGVFFGGLSLKVPLIGFRLTIEGAYSTTQVAYLGTKVGFSF